MQHEEALTAAKIAANKREDSGIFSPMSRPEHEKLVDSYYLFYRTNSGRSFFEQPRELREPREPSGTIMGA
jgi:hypothetical protein